MIVALLALERSGVRSRKCAELDIFVIEHAVTAFALANGGRYPDSLQSVVAPDANGKTLLSRVPVDPWGRAYVYEPPGSERTRPRVSTYGKDGRSGGSGADSDIDNLTSFPGR